MTTYGMGRGRIRTGKNELQPGRTLPRVSDVMGPQVRAGWRTWQDGQPERRSTASPPCLRGRHPDGAGRVAPQRHGMEEATGCQKIEVSGHPDYPKHLHAKAMPDRRRVGNQCHGEPPPGWSPDRRVRPGPSPVKHALPAAWVCSPWVRSPRTSRTRTLVGRAGDVAPTSLSAATTWQDREPYADPARHLLSEGHIV